MGCDSPIRQRSFVFNHVYARNGVLVPTNGTLLYCNFVCFCPYKFAPFFIPNHMFCCAAHGAMLHWFLQALMILHSNYKHFKMFSRNLLCKIDAMASYFWIILSYQTMANIASVYYTFCNVCGRCGCHTHTPES